MNKLAVLLFVFAICACCISAFPSSLPSGYNVRIVRAALPDPDPHHHHHQHHYRPQSYGGDYYSGYDNYDNYGYYNQGYGNNYYPHQNGGQSLHSSNANAATFNTPWGSGSYAQAQANSGSGGGLFF